MELNNFEHFHTLKEIQSLHRHIEKHLQQISSEESRINKLLQQKNSRQQDLEHTEDKLKAINANISEIEKINQQLYQTISQADLNYNSIKNNQELDRFKKQQDELKLKKDECDQRLFQLYEVQDELETSIKDSKTFLQGIKKTLEEINVEAQKLILEDQKSIQNYEHRVSLLVESLPKPFADRYQLVFKKMKLSSITIINGNTCGACSFLISKLQISQVDKGNLECCPNCSRIFLPYRTQS